VNTLASKWITDENRVIIALAPEKQGVKTPTREDLLAVFDRAAKTPVVAYTENISGDALLDRDPDTGEGRGGEVGTGHQRHRVEVVERRARAREAHRLQGRRSPNVGVQPGRNIAGE
jgi:hypothetical protein